MKSQKTNLYGNTEWLKIAKQFLSGLEFKCILCERGGIMGIHCTLLLV